MRTDSMASNLLKVNDSKTEVLLLVTNHQRKQIGIKSINIGDANIDFSSNSSCRNLGVYFDADLSFRSHVTKTAQSAHFHLRNIGKIRKFLDQDSTKILVHSMIMSRLDYGNALLYGAPSFVL